MFYSAELEFFRRILKNLNINSAVVAESELPENEIDFGLRKFIGYGSSFTAQLCGSFSENTVYCVRDSFGCSYIFMVLPETEERSVLAAGPYLNSEITYERLAQEAEKRSLPSFMFDQLVKYFGNLTVVSDDRYIMTVCNTLAETMWKGQANFTVERTLDCNETVISIDNADLYESKADEAMLSVRALEERYAAENRMMQAVSQGNVHAVEQLFGSVSSLVFEQRANDPVRNMKNYLIIGNTLMRKAVEQGSVHPFYIDGVSAGFAKKIEQIKSVADAGELMQAMVKKYCGLVKTHSMKNYSPFVQKIITIIDSDLTADLSLSNFARNLNVNSSYLSVLFKKETGKTLTEYVAQKRIERAAYLLRTTKLQVQTVAQNCGIYDVNYFAKMFKKITGKTPKEYRNGI